MQSKNLNFGQALEALKQGKAVARAGWNGRGMSLWLNKGSIHSEHVDLSDEVIDETLKDIQDSPEAHLVEGVRLSLFENGNEGTVTRLPNINMTAASGSTVTGWLASQTDMLAEDWTILE